MTTPVFSIITVVYNSETLIEGTIRSVMAQSWQNYEYIIMDGASKDNTLLIAREYAHKMPQIRVFSEKDKGLYDAMNKALALATGDFVLFLNSGDHLHAPDTLALIAAQITPQTDVLYGDTRVVNDERNPLGLMSQISTRSLPQHLTWQHYLGGMRVVHQSFLPRRL
jgi:glycosyltransferase involved in cell wall biosynthesis